MKGLLLKDLALMKTQAHSVVIIITIAVFMLLVGENTTFPIIYTNMIFVMLGITTLNYDTFDNGYSFLFTLPITRKLYVLEKYVFSLLSAATGVVFSLILMFLTTLVKEQYVLSSFELSFVLGYGLASIVFSAIMLPVELKFGPEKGRIAMIGVIAIIVASAFALKEIVGEITVSKFFIWMSTFTPIWIWGILALVVCGLLFISYNVSCKIIEKKEF